MSVAIEQKRFFESRPRPLNLNRIKKHEGGGEAEQCGLLCVTSTGRLLSQYVENMTHTEASWITPLSQPFMDVMIWRSLSKLFWFWQKKKH